MNAVNLIPADSRKRRLAPSTSWPTLALFGALLVVLAGAVLYVTAANNVKSRQTELARVTASVNSWRSVAGSYQFYTQAAQQRSQELADIRQLALGRYPWEHLLSQVAGLMPSDASLTTLQATTSASQTGSTSSSTSSAQTGSSSSSTSSAQTGSSSSSTSSAQTGSSSSSSSSTPATGSAASPLPSVQLTGCASSQSTVAQTMVQLHRIEGVSAVTLASSVDNSASATSAPSTGSASAGSGSCPYSVQFQMSLAFAAPAPTAAASAAGSGTGASSPSTSSTGSGSTPASASTNSTGVQSQ